MTPIPHNPFTYISNAPSRIRNDLFYLHIQYTCIYLSIYTYMTWDLILSDGMLLALPECEFSVNKSRHVNNTFEYILYFILSRYSFIFHLAFSVNPVFLE